MRSEEEVERTRRYLFDEFEVNPADRVLLRKGEEVSLTAKVFDLLLVFLSNPGRLLTKEELIETIWPESFVEEGNLARNVSMLRKVLRDTGKDHRLILTVQGIGYRFIAEVRIEESEPVRFSVLPADEGAAIPQSRKPGTASAFVWRHRISLAILLVTATVVAAVTVYESGVFSGRKEVASQVGQRRLTHSGKMVAETISRDGRYVGFAKFEDSYRALYVRRVDSENSLELVPRKLGASYWAVDISPDDKFVYYITKESDDPTGRIYRIPLIGGKPEKLVDHADGAVTLSGDGGKMAFTRIDRANGTSSIIVAAVDGSNERILGSVKLESQYLSLDWLPDDKSLLIVTVDRGQRGNFWKISELPLTGGPEKPIGKPSRTPIFTARWIKDSKGIIINRIDNKTHLPQLYFLSYPDLKERQITFDPEGNRGLELTDDGQTLLTTEQSSNRRLWVQDRPGADRYQPVTDGTRMHYDAVSWLDEDHLVFDEDENGSFDLYNIWVSNADGTGRKQLTRGNGYNYQPAAAPDGSLIAFVSKRTGSRQLWVMQPDGTGQRLLTVMEGDVFRPKFTKDGRWLYYAVDAAGKTSVWKIRVSGGKPISVLPPGVVVWAVSPSGDAICYSSLGTGIEGGRTVIRHLTGELAEKPIDATPASWIEWRSDGTAVLFDSATDSGKNVWEYSLKTGKVRKVTDFEDEVVFRCAESPVLGRRACIRSTYSNDLLLISTSLETE